MKKGLIAVGITIIALFLLVGGVFLSMTMKQKSTLEALSYSEIEMSKVEDGSYTGNADTTMVKVTVEVTVFDHAIQKVEIINHENGMGTPAEAIVTDMIAQNCYDVDAVSGATISSKVIKSAVCNALSKGIK